MQVSKKSFFMLIPNIIDIDVRQPATSRFLSIRLVKIQYDTTIGLYRFEFVKNWFSRNGREAASRLNK
jgi:hypothetical protein